MRVGWTMCFGRRRQSQRRLAQIMADEPARQRVEKMATEDGARRPYFPRRNEWTTEYLKFSAPMPGPELDADGKRMFMSVAEKEPITSSAIHVAPARARQRRVVVESRVNAERIAADAARRRAQPKIPGTEPAAARIPPEASWTRATFRTESSRPRSRPRPASASGGASSKAESTCGVLELEPHSGSVVAVEPEPHSSPWVSSSVNSGVRTGGYTGRARQDAWVQQ